MLNTMPRLGLFLVLIIALTLPLVAGAHGGETSIIPESLVLKAGSEVKVEVGGLVGADEVTFELQGMFGATPLGSYKIKSDDFTQTLSIPDSVEPGSYSLTVSGGGKSAKVVVTVK